MASSSNTRMESPSKGCDTDWAVHLRRLAATGENLLAFLSRRGTREPAWHKERELFQAIIDQVPDYLFVKDRDSRFVIANKAVAADLGLGPEDLQGKTDFDLHPHKLASKFFADEQNVINTEQPMLDIEEFVVEPCGRQKWLSTSKVPLRNGGGDVIGIIGISRDVTEKKIADAQIQHMAHHDSLTGLGNRVLLLGRMNRMIAEAKRDGTGVAAVFVDLDNFKIINDSLGHRAGDTLLKKVAERMMRSVRTNDTVVRFAGDEFIILVSEETPESQLHAFSIVKRLQDRLTEPITIDSHSFKVSCSIGIASYPKDACNAEELLMYADFAMYAAKERGRDTCASYSVSMKCRSSRHG